MTPVPFALTIRSRREHPVSPIPDIVAVDLSCPLLPAAAEHSPARVVVQAATASETVLEALAQAGYAVVPLIPSHSLLRAMAQRCARHGDGTPTPEAMRAVHAAVVGLGA